MPALAPIRTAAPEDAAPSPCFYWRLCRGTAALEKGGKAVCQRCADLRLGGRGREYPLRPPARAPLYPNGRAAAEAMEMLERSPKPLNRSE